MKRLTIALLFVCVTAQAQVTPTTEWISVWSQTAGLNGQVLPAGSRVQALDPDGVVCGEAVATAPGQFGLMPVYRDDPATTADEGADPGDVIRFKLAGFNASSAVPVVWEFNGQTTNVTVQAQGVIPTPEWISIWSDGTTVAGQPVQPGAVVRAFDPAGVLCGEAVAHGPGAFGLMPVYRDDPATGFDEGAGPGDQLSFEVDGVQAAAASPVLWTGTGEVIDVDLAADVVPTLLLSSSVRWAAGGVDVRWVLYSDESVRTMTVWRGMLDTGQLIATRYPGSPDYEVRDDGAPGGERLTYSLVVETAQERYASDLISGTSTENCSSVSETTMASSVKP